MSDRGIRPLPDGRYRAYVWAGGRELRRVFPTKTLARAWREKTLTAYREGTLGRDLQSQTPFADAVDAFLEWSERSCRKSTYATDRSCAKGWLASRHLKKPVEQIRGADVEEYRKDLLEKGAKPRSADLQLGRLKRLFEKLIDWEVLDRNPAARIKLLRLDDARTTVLSHADLEAMFEHCGPELRRAAAFALLTGARRSEVVGLEWADVDLDAGLASLPASKVKGKRTRVLYLNPEAVAVLREVRSEPEERRGRVFGRWTPEGLTRAWVRARARLNVKRAKEGLPAVGWRFHDLRHTFGSRLAQGGAEAFAIQRAMDHREIRTTQRYVHLGAQHMKGVVALASIRHEPDISNKE